MIRFSITLEARDPARNIWRHYTVNAGQDLLGDWVVAVQFGRIGAYGRIHRYACPNEEAARKRVGACLRRRRSAPARIGVAYAVTDRDDAEGWLTGMHIDNYKSIGVYT